MQSLHLLVALVMGKEAEENFLVEPEVMAVGQIEGHFMTVDLAAAIITRENLHKDNGMLNPHKRVPFNINNFGQILQLRMTLPMPLELACTKRRSSLTHGRRYFTRAVSPTPFQRAYLFLLLLLLPMHCSAHSPPQSQLRNHTSNNSSLLNNNNHNSRSSNPFRFI